LSTGGELRFKVLDHQRQKVDEYPRVVKGPEHHREDCDADRDGILVRELT
jgi:hypothetical protein